MEFILFFLLGLGLSNTSQPVTYTKTIKPIIQKRCTPCHTGVLPSLPNFTIYKNAFEKRTEIRKRVYEKKTMPPGGGTITDVERKIIKVWVDQGAKK